MRARRVRGGLLLLVGAGMVSGTLLAVPAVPYATAQRGHSSDVRTSATPRIKHARISFAKPYYPETVDAVTSAPGSRWYVAGQLERLDLKGFGNLYVVRVGRDGRLDDSFGQQGWAKFATLEGRSSVPAAIAVDRRGRVVIAGTIVPDRELDPDDDVRPWHRGFVIRLRQDGSLDKSFGQRGRKFFRYRRGAPAEVNAMHIEKDGSIVVVGTSRNNLGIARLSPRGDFRSATSGRWDVQPPTISASCPDVGASAASLLANEGSTWIVGGSTAFPQPSGCFAARALLVGKITSEGKLDNTFGSSGTTMIPVSRGSGTSWASLARDPSGRILAAGQASPGSKREAIVGRFLANGSVDPSFGDGGTRKLLRVGKTGQFSGAVSVWSDHAGRVVVGGATTRDNSWMAILRLLPDGRLDRTFGRAGVMVVERGVFYGKLARSRDGTTLVASAKAKRAGQYMALALVHDL